MLAERFVPDYQFSYITPEVEEIKERSETYSAHLNYRVGRWDLLPDFQSNATVLAKVDEIIQELKNELSSFVEELQSEEGNVVITNQRHFEALQKSLDSVVRVEEAVQSQITTELLAYELRNALEQLGEISGEFTNDEVLGNIFSKFCIGK